MNNLNLNNLAEIEITARNCDEVQEAAMRLFMRALKVCSHRDLEKIRSEEMSLRIKQGLRAKKERDQILNQHQGAL